MIQPGKRLTSPQMEEFLSNQNTTGRFIFKIHEYGQRPTEEIFQNTSESFAFIEEHPDVIYEFQYSADYI